MTDISKCANQTCTKRLHCWRYTAPGGEWQSYADFQQDPVTGNCPDFWDNDNRPGVPANDA